MNRRLLSGAALLFSGNGVNALASTAATLLMAWRMGPEAWGVLAVILTYGSFLDMLVNVQIWQALTHFAGTAKAESNLAGFRQTVGQLLCVDFIGASSAEHTSELES